MPVAAVGVAAPMGAMTIPMPIPMSSVMIAAVDVRAVVAVNMGAVMDVSAMMRGVMSATVMAAAMRGMMPATMTTAVMAASMTTMTTAVAAVRHRAP